MPIISIDLAYRSYRDIGVVVMREDNDHIDVEIQKIPLDGKPSPEAFAAYAFDLAKKYSASYVLIDGPQAWKDPNNGLVHSRICERALNTPAKTGLPNCVKPGNYLHFVAFSIACFDELSNLGCERLNPKSAAGRITTIETFPLSAWRSLSLPQLPAKAKCNAITLNGRRASLEGVFPLRFSDSPTHDELQAAISGIAGLAYEAGNIDEYCLSGVAPFELGGLQREGFIINPMRRILRET